MIEDNSVAGDVPDDANVEAHPTRGTDAVSHSQNVTQGKEGVNVTPQTRSVCYGWEDELSSLHWTDILFCIGLHLSLQYCTELEYELLCTGLGTDVVAVQMMFQEINAAAVMLLLWFSGAETRSCIL
ncbi:unnamed protein product [Ilex paraguariensis]|uniref:Uncharacterized protein n=1 Tax=Ilex paraguariensis TaxID=185542 RepID=A0ABC8R4Y5_9AQUA